MFGTPRIEGGWYLHINSSWIFCSLLLLLIHMDYPWAHVEDFLFHNCFWQFKRLTRRLLKENQLLVIRKLRYDDMLHFKLVFMIYQSRIFRNDITHNTIRNLIRYAHFCIHHINLKERRSPENNLSNLMRHRLKKRHEKIFWPTNYFDWLILNFKK